jgi:hypothetical protein
LLLLPFVILIIEHDEHLVAGNIHVHIRKVADTLGLIVVEPPKPTKT